MNMHEAFNTALFGIIKQGGPSVAGTGVNEGRCLYRGPNGFKCGVGWLIPDDQYREEFEGKSPSNELIGVAWVAAEVPALQGFSIDFLSDLQDAHDEASVSNIDPIMSVRDGSEFLRLFLTNMQRVSNTWGLGIEVPTIEDAIAIRDSK